MIATVSVTRLVARQKFARDHAVINILGILPWQCVCFNVPGRVSAAHSILQSCKLMMTEIRRDPKYQAKETFEMQSTSQDNQLQI